MKPDNINTGTVKIGNIEFTNLSDREIEIFRRQHAAGIPLPFELDEHLDSFFLLRALPEDQQRLIRETSDPMQKRHLISSFIQKFIDDEN